MINYRWTNKRTIVSQTMDNSKFPDALKQKLKDLGMRPSELARRTGISKQNISRIINQSPHPITNAPAKTTEDAVLKIAEALNWDASEALMLAGYAPVDLPSNYAMLGHASTTTTQIYLNPQAEHLRAHSEKLNQ